MNVANSFGTIASDTILTDVNMLIVGFALLYMYVNLMLGKFNLVEQRVGSVYACWGSRSGRIFRATGSWFWSDFQYGRIRLLKNDAYP